MSDGRRAFRRPALLARIMMLTLVVMACARADDPSGADHAAIHGMIWCRDRVDLPLGTTVDVTIEDIAKPGTPVDVLADMSLDPWAGPPWSFELPYDPQRMHEPGPYLLRVKVAINGKVMFTNNQNTVVKAADSTPVAVFLSRVHDTQADHHAGAVDSSLTDTYWKLVELDGQALEPDPDGRELHMVLHGDAQRVTGFGGCNHFMGAFYSTGNHLLFQQLASTRMACTRTTREQEFLSALQATLHFDIHGQELDLYSGDGHLRLRFQAVALL